MQFQAEKLQNQTTCLQKHINVGFASFAITIIIQESKQLCKLIFAMMHFCEGRFIECLTKCTKFVILAPTSKGNELPGGDAGFTEETERGLFMKKILVAMLTLCLFVAPMTGLADEAKAKSEHIVTTAISADVVTLDVMLNNSQPGTTVTKALFGGLYKYDQSGTQAVPCYAESYELSDDQLVYTFKMKDGIAFSDGTPMDANDVYYSYMYVLAPSTGSTLTTDLWAVKNAKAYATGEVTDPEQVGIKLIDDKTIEFTLDAPTPWFITATAVSYPIVKKGIYEENAQWWKDAATYVCSGPFVLESYTPLASYILRKNPHYPDADKMEIEGLDIMIIETQETQLTAYRNGEIDAFFDVTSIDALSEYANSDEFFTVDRLGIMYCDFNCRLEEFKDVRVRTAFAIAIDRQWILESILESSQKPVYGFVPHSQPSLGDPTKTYREVAGDLFEEDVARAQQLMAEAGYPNGEGFPTVELVVRATEEQKNLAQALQSLWQENLGVTVEIRTVEAGSTYWAELAEGKFSIDRSGYTVNYLDPSANLLIWKTGGNAFENQWPDDEGRTEFNDMMTAANAIIDPAAREAALIECEKYLVEMMPGFPAYSYNVVYLVKPYVQNLHKTVTNLTTWEYATFAQ